MSRVQKGRSFISGAREGDALTVTLDDGIPMQPDKTIASKSDNKVTFTDGTYVYLNLGSGLQYFGPGPSGLRTAPVKHLQGSGSSLNINYTANTNRTRRNRNRRNNNRRARKTNRNKNSDLNW